MTRAALVALILALAAFAGLSRAAGASSLAGFAPESIATAGGQNLWVLGTVPCHASKCLALLRSADAGRHFERVTAPPADGTIRFADARDGFVYGVSSLWATRDGGLTWHLSLRHVLAFATGGRRVYAVTGRCASNGSCSNVRLARSRAGTDAWVSSSMPFAQATPNFDLAARGSAVWLFGGSSVGRYRLKDVLARSVNAGRTFVTGQVPCYADLAAELEPISSRVVWAFCPTGMMGIAWRSVNGGSSFAALRIPLCCFNGTSLAPASETTAVVSVDAGSRLRRSTDGGRTWRAARAPLNVTTWGPIEFADARVGFGLVSAGTRGTEELLRTTDAGASWQRVSIS